MEPKRDSSLPGIATVILWLLSSFLAAAAAAPPTDALPGCPQTCGHVEIPYPFGIGPNCSLAGFELNCSTTKHGKYKPFYFNVEFLSISLSSGQARINNEISWQCYNITSRNTSFIEWSFDFSGSPYWFSNNLNTFTAIGCDTLAYIVAANSKNDYETGCASLCENKASLITNSSCSGIGCCQTAIPKGIDYYEVWFDERFNSSDVWNFSRCSYAVLAETSWFKFNISYITTNEFLKITKVPLVLDWAIGNETCLEARQNKTSYACVSDNSVCVDSLNGPGYLCNCSMGYQGNPYLPQGCQGTSISIIILLVMSLCAYIIYQRKKLSKVKEKFFQQHGGRLLLEEIGKQQGLAFTIFTKEELEQATNKFDKNNILGQGGHGIVYKGTLKDDRVVAIKNPTIIDEAQKKEFGKEMLILSQINHKNIVKILGCCLEVQVPMLVYEFIPNGTLFQLIHRKNLWSLVSLETRLQIALDSAEALAYLHSSASPSIIHGDVKSSNILLDDHLNAKVSDFGASTLALTDEIQFVTLVQGTCGYLDPEYLQTCQLTDKSDVYSFGVVLLELLTGKKAFYFKGPEESKNLSSSFLSAAKEHRVWQLIDDLIKNEEEKDLIEEVAELARACLNVRGEERPSMKEVAEELGRLRKLKQHPWEQNPEEMESLLGESRKYHAEESTTYFSLEKKGVQGIGSGR